MEIKVISTPNPPRPPHPLTLASPENWILLCVKRFITLPYFHRKNSMLLSVAFLGYFNVYPPTEDALMAAPVLVQYLVNIGKLRSNGLCLHYDCKHG